MKITTFNPLITTRDADAAIAIFEALGFEKRHVKEGVGEENFTDTRMTDANGFHVDVTHAPDELMMIRMNVDNLDEAIALLEAHGFHKAIHKVTHETIETFDTGSSKFSSMVSSSGIIFAVSQHTPED